MTKEVDGLPPHHKFLASEFVEHSLGRRANELLGSSDPRTSELLLRLRFGAVAGRPKKSRKCPHCHDEEAIRHHDGDPQPVRNCDYVDHILHECESEAASTLRAEAQEICNLWAPRGLRITLASATWVFPALDGLWPPNELPMDLRGLPSLPARQLRRRGVEPSSFADLLHRLYKPLEGFMQILDRAPPGPVCNPRTTTET